LSGLAHEYIVERQSDLLAILSAVIEVENYSHIVVALDEFLLTSDCDAGPSNLYLAKWVGSGELVLLT
jgi:hypothetical protein